jgi:hypothetical protein
MTMLMQELQVFVTANKGVKGATGDAAMPGPSRATLQSVTAVR